MSVSQYAGALGLLAAGVVGAFARGDLRYLRRKSETNWDAVREHLGYGPSQAKQELPKAEPPRRFLGKWRRINWDEERRRLGYDSDPPIDIVRRLLGKDH